MNYLFSGTTNLGINKFCNLIRSALQFMCTNTFYIKLKQVLLDLLVLKDVLETKVELVL